MDISEKIGDISSNITQSVYELIDAVKHEQWYTQQRVEKELQELLTEFATEIIKECKKS